MNNPEPTPMPPTNPSEPSVNPSLQADLRTALEANGDPPTSAASPTSAATSTTARFSAHLSPPASDGQNGPSRGPVSSRLPQRHRWSKRRKLLTIATLFLTGVVLFV